MSDIFFFLKTLILTVAVVLVMQVQVGERTIENHALGWVQSSPIAAELNAVAKGAAKLIKETADSIQKKFKDPFR